MKKETCFVDEKSRGREACGYVDSHEEVLLHEILNVLREILDVLSLIRNKE